MFLHPRKCGVGLIGIDLHMLIISTDGRWNECLANDMLMSSIVRILDGEDGAHEDGTADDINERAR